jgi:lauroyl/myristoyl acyltransferase
MARHLAIAFDGRLSAGETDQIIRECYREVWREALSLLPTAGDWAALRQAKIEGWEHLQSALASGRGAILWEASMFGSRNASKQILRDRGIAVHQVHATSHAGWRGVRLRWGTWLRRRIVVPTIHRWMSRLVASVIWLRRGQSPAASRVLWDLLGHNGVVCSAADGTLGARLALDGYLGRRRVFATGMVSLARLTGAALLPMFCIQNQKGIPTLTIGPPIQVDEGVDRQRAARSCITQWLRLFETHVKAHPGKYRAWHATYWDGTHADQ